MTRHASLPASFALAALAALLLSGCLARTALDMAPVRAVDAAVDLATTSRSEADEERGRALRQRDERLGQLYRDTRHHSRQCDEGQAQTCARAKQNRADIDAILNERY